MTCLPEISPRGCLVAVCVNITHLPFIYRRGLPTCTLVYVTWVIDSYTATAHHTCRLFVRVLLHYVTNLRLLTPALLIGLFPV